MLWQTNGDKMEQLTNSLQENIITLLVFDTDTVPLIMNNISTDLFGNSYYREIARRSIQFYNDFGDAPKEHIADLFEAELGDVNNKDIYNRILKALHENKYSINKEYILNSLDKFITLQNLKITAKDLLESLQKNDLDKAESVLAKAKKTQVSVFDPGTFLIKDMDSTLDFLDHINQDLILTGIRALDVLEICPAPKELYVLVARSGAGKSWFMTHLGKFAMMQRKKVLHISLELSEQWVNARYMQSFFSMTSKVKPDQKQNAVFTVDRFGSFTDLDLVDLIGVRSLREKDISKVLLEKAKKLLNPQLIVKFFPTGTLSIGGLNAYLDNLEALYNFIPDIILLDYLDNMNINPDNMRLELGKTAIDLRGIAGERNLAMVTVAQTNALAEKTQVITRKHLAEDFSKIRVADNLITYNQMREGEKKLGVGRLYIEKARNSVDGKIIHITQNYSIGQFCLQSFEEKDNSYFPLLKSKGLIT